MSRGESPHRRKGVELNNLYGILQHGELLERHADTRLLSWEGKMAASFSRIQATAVHSIFLLPPEEHSFKLRTMLSTP